jgi:hypothetical protein
MHAFAVLKGNRRGCSDSLEEKGPSGSTINQ